jgi:hypothetical protein
MNRPVSLFCPEGIQLEPKSELNNAAWLIDTKTLLRHCIMIRRLLVLLVFATTSVSAQEPYVRDFRMGFTPFPPSFNAAGYEQSYQIIREHADLISHTFQGGIPWDAALSSSDYRDFPVNLQQNWDFLLAADANNIPGMARYVSVLPTNIHYNALATLWNDNGPGQPLGAPWDTAAFNSPEVKTALLNYSIALIDTFQPEYFGLGVEINILMAKRFDVWEDYKELNQYVYTELKLRYPDLYIFPTIQYEHMLGLHDYSRQLVDYLSEFYPTVLWWEMYQLMFYSDAFVISTFPYLSYGNYVYDGYYDLAFNLAAVHNIPLAIDQMGSLSRDVDVGPVILRGSEQVQQDTLYYLLSLAYQADVLFAVNFFTRDYAENYGTNPVSLSWAYTGLFNADGTPKPAVSTWDLFLALPYQKPN